MECRDVRPLAEAFVSEQLLVETTGAMVQHLDRCPACRAEVDGLRRLRAATRSAFAASAELVARPEFLAVLGAQLRAEAAPRSTARPQRVWLALAAGLLLLVGAGAGFRLWSVSQLTGLLQAAVGDHRFCALTFKLTEPPITLDEAARRYDLAYGALQTVEPSDARLRGGALRVVERHSCVFNGRRFAHIVLHYKDETVSLLVAGVDDRPLPGWAPGRARENAIAAVPGIDGFQVSTFHGSRHVVFVVSSLGQDDVQDVARAMAGPMMQALAGV